MVRVTSPIFPFWLPGHIFQAGEARDFKFGFCKLIVMSTTICMSKFHSTEMYWALRRVNTAV